MVTVQRQSNIELLRILCMFFVVMFHFNLNVILRNGETSQGLNYMALLVNSLVVVAVNTFVLISGYFSIKIKMKSILSFLVQTEFYAVLAIVFYIIYSYVCSTSVSKGIILNLTPFNPIGLWFVPCYAMLLFISPLLNWICKDKKAHFVVLTMVFARGVILYILIGYEGYSIANFILMYLIGRWIALYPNKLTKMRSCWITSLLIVSVCMTFVLALWWINRGHDIADKKIFAYSSPIVIMSSVLLFILFKNLTLSKQWINLVAPSVLSVYLFHENGLVKNFIYIKPLRHIIAIVPSDFISYLCVVLYGLILFAIVIIFDRFVRIKIQDMIVNALMNKIRVLKIIDSNLLKLNE